MNNPKHTQQHTPLPYTLKPDNTRLHGWFDIWGSDNSYIGLVKGEERAQQIVEACNSYYTLKQQRDELLEACKRIQKAPYGVAVGDLEFLEEAIARVTNGGGNE